VGQTLEQRVPREVVRQGDRGDTDESDEGEEGEGLRGAGQKPVL
jgi:hypothetical protein